MPQSFALGPPTPMLGARCEHGRGSVRVGDSMDDSFAAYLAKVLAAKHGFSPGTVPEAGRLAGAADFVLTKLDGLTCSVVCIVDAERDPSRRFGLGRDELIAIGKTCRAKYSGTVNGAKMPAIIEIVEILSSVTDEDRERLKPLRSRLGAVALAYGVDLSTSTVTVTTSPAGAAAGTSTPVRAMSV